MTSRGGTGTVRRRRQLLLALVAAALPACGGSAGPAEETGAGFIAQGSSFAGFQQWPRFEISGELPGSPHVGLQRTVYVNQLPPAGASEFPVGTIVLKTASGSDEIHAMVKRGPEYNVMGARGWEWFELKFASNGELAIAWRGITPPAGVCKTYGGIAGGACNVCHQVAAGNDFVQTPALTLARAPAP
jgi:hypothetical protein